MIIRCNHVQQIHTKKNINNLPTNCTSPWISLAKIKEEFSISINEEEINNCSTIICLFKNRRFNINSDNFYFFTDIYKVNLEIYIWKIINNKINMNLLFKKKLYVFLKISCLTPYLNNTKWKRKEIKGNGIKKDITIFYILLFNLSY